LPFFHPAAEDRTTKRETYLVAYDVRDPKRLVRLHRFLKTRARALQYSVFLASLTRAERRRLLADIGRLIDRKADDVRLYPVPPGADLTLTGRSLLPDGVLMIDGSTEKAASTRKSRRSRPKTDEMR
jgi:CRISPR-associated protein Cas2